MPCGRPINQNIPGMPLKRCIFLAIYEVPRAFPSDAARESSRNRVNESSINQVAIGPASSVDCHICTNLPPHMCLQTIQI